MSDKKRSNRNSDDMDPRSGDSQNRETRGGSVWFVIIGVILAVMMSALLFGTNSRAFRYPDLTRLLIEHAKQAEIEENGGTPTIAKVIVASSKDPEILLEYSDLQLVLLGDEEITGIVN